MALSTSHTENTGFEKDAALQLLENNQELQGANEDLHFHFDRSRFVASEGSAIEVTRSMRIRGVLQAIRETCDDVDLPADLGVVKRADSYFSQKVTIGSESMTRYKAGSVKEVEGSLLQDLSEEKHPVAIALKQLRDEFDEDELNKHDLWQTVEGVLRATHYDQIREKVDEKISGARAQAKVKKYISKDKRS